MKTAAPGTTDEGGIPAKPCRSRAPERVELAVRNGRMEVPRAGEPSTPAKGGPSRRIPSTRAASAAVTPTSSPAITPAGGRATGHSPATAAITSTRAAVGIAPGV